MENKVNNEINVLREEIDKLDQEIIKLLNSRYSYTDKIGKLKKTNNIKVLDNKREEIILQSIIKIVDESNIKDIQSIYAYIMKLSKDRQ